jgi:hypothetical protein
MVDIAKTMKEKDVFNGSLQLECVKDQTTVFQMDNDFSKNTSTGQMKANIKTEMNYDGKNFKHESSTEFTTRENSIVTATGSKEDIRIFITSITANTDTAV